MKTRIGFVSNSSSSSFICDVCKRHESGFDTNCYDFDMAQCVNKHTFCTRHMKEMEGKEVTAEQKKAFLLKRGEINASEIDDYDDDDIKDMYDECMDEYDYERVSEEKCPICSFKAAYDAEMLKYLLKKLDIAEYDILKEVREKFKNYNEFKKYIS